VRVFKLNTAAAYLIEIRGRTSYKCAVFAVISLLQQLSHSIFCLFDCIIRLCSFRSRHTTNIVGMNRPTIQQNNLLYGRNRTELNLYCTVTISTYNNNNHLFRIQSTYHEINYSHAL
jgi:hypothetical protein